MSNCAEDVLDETLIRHLRDVRPKCWADNLSWLPDADIELHFDDWLCEYYSHVKMFHGCRPLNLATYYEHGLRGQNAEIIVLTFREIFQDVESRHIDAAIAEMAGRGESEHGHVYFVSDDQHLVNESGHYLIQGSEYLMALAATLCEHKPGEDYRWRLRNIGIPTMIEVDVPVRLIPYVQIQSLSRSMLSEWAQLKARRPLGRHDGYSFIVHRDVPPQHIVRHWHPALIRDPHQRTIYRNTSVSCDYC